jgi:hypothetical protein
MRTTIDISDDLMKKAKIHAGDKDLDKEIEEMTQTMWKRLEG